MAKILQITRAPNSPEVTPAGKLWTAQMSGIGDGNKLLNIDTSEKPEKLDAEVVAAIVRQAEKVQAQIEHTLGENIENLEARIADNIPGDDEDDEWENPESSLEIVGRLWQGKNIEIVTFKSTDDDEFKEGKIRIDDVDDDVAETRIEEREVDILIAKMLELRETIQTEFFRYPEVGSVEVVRLENGESWKVLAFLADPETAE